MEDASGYRISLEIADDRRARGAVAVDCEIEDGVARGRSKRVRDFGRGSLYGQRLELVAVDVRGRHAFAAQRLHLLAEDRPSCDAQLCICHFLSVRLREI